MLTANGNSHNCHTVTRHQHSLLVPAAIRLWLSAELVLCVAEPASGDLGRVPRRATPRHVRSLCIASMATVSPEAWHAQEEDELTDVPSCCPQRVAAPEVRVENSSVSMSLSLSPCELACTEPHDTHDTFSSWFHSFFVLFGLLILFGKRASIDSTRLSLASSDYICLGSSCPHTRTSCRWARCAGILVKHW